MKKSIVAILSMALLSMALVSCAPNKSSLDEQKINNFKKDWLIDASAYKAGIYRNQDDNNIILSNGLIRRMYKTGPNCGTVAFDNLMTGESILRALSPEAEIVLNGTTLKVGGFSQPAGANRAYITGERIENLTNDEEAMQFVGFKAGPIEKRFDYKPVGLGTDYNWPPKGVHLQLDYKLPESTNPNAKRKVLYKDDFKNKTLDGGWKVHTSKAHPRSSFANEGKLGEIYTPGNTCVYAERKLDADTEVIQARFDAGTDTVASWGNGIAIEWKNRRAKFYMRPGEEAFGLWHNDTGEQLIGDTDETFDFSKPIYLRVRMANKKIYCEASKDAKLWKKVITVDNSAMGKPIVVKLGKSSRTGGDDDHTPSPGELTRSHVMEYTAYGAIEKPKGEKADSGVTVSVHYNLYDGIPLMSKWFTLKNNGNKPVHLNTFTSEILAYVERSSSVEARRLGGVETRPNMHIESDYQFGGMDAESANAVVHHEFDRAYTSQVNYRLETKCLLKTYLPKGGPDVDIPAGDTFESFRVYEMPYDSYVRERQGLYRRKMYRTIAPWTQENPLMHHVRRADWNSVKNAVDQAVEVGFEMIIMTFGSGFNIENDSDAYLKEMKRYAEYAHSKGIRIGGYSLLSSRRIGGGNDVISIAGEKPQFGNAPCILSKWGEDYFRKITEFYEKTGMDLLEHDGSYPGDPCNAKNHDHSSYESSQWLQWNVISDYYKWCRSEGIFLNVPDVYFLSGSNKTGMGYREVNWSLPRGEQVMHTRQNIYDGTWTKTPSMGWMFVPLSQYHGGGAAATIEPLDKHIDHYERMIQSNLSMGVQACYRGPRLYDTDRVRDMLKRNVDWYKKYRGILESDIVHGRRCDARDIDWVLHANPKLKEKGMLVVFNPLKEKVNRTIKANLYYTGLAKKAKIRHQEGRAKTYNLARDYTIEIPVEIQAEGFTWLVIE